MNKNTVLIVTIAALLLTAATVAGIFYLGNKRSSNKLKEINSYEECAKAGYPIREIYPPVCVLPDGREFTQEVTLPDEEMQEDVEKPEEQGGDGIGIANPASVNCTEKGGRLEIRSTEGGETGFCIFEDGSECEEWAFLRGECKKGENKK